MNPAVAAKGNSFKGAVAYITRDVGRQTAERVAFAGTLNLRTDDPEKAAKVMAWTALHAGDLKRAAGLPATGNKLANPVYHFALTWEPSQNPSPQEMTTAVTLALTHLGLQEHEAVYAAHRDTAHPHIHVVVNRVHPQTGRAVNPPRDYDRLQYWSWQYEKAHGHIFCVDRALRFERDPQQRAELLRRQAVERERGGQRPNLPRPQWEAERDIPHPTSREATAIRAEHGAQAKALHAESRDQAARQRAERSALWQDHQENKRALWAQQQAEYRATSAAATKPHHAALQPAQKAERAALKARQQREWRQQVSREQAVERPPVDRLFRAQRTELQAFLRTSHRQGWVGALATAVQAMRQAPPPAGSDKRSVLAQLARFAAVAVSADRRAKLFLAGQKDERDRLRAHIRRQQAPQRNQARKELRGRQAEERQALSAQHHTQRQQVVEAVRQHPAQVARTQRLRERFAAARFELQRSYVKANAELTHRHTAERKGLQKRWAAHHVARQAAWTRYRQERANVRQVNAARPAERKAERLSRAFGDVGRQADGRAASRARQADAGRAAPTTPATALGDGRSRGPN